VKQNALQKKTCREISSLAPFQQGFFFLLVFSPTRKGTIAILDKKIGR